MRRFSKKHFLAFFASLVLIFGTLLVFGKTSLRTSANGEFDDDDSAELHYVTIFDAGADSVTIRTPAKTVAEVLDLLEINIGEYDSVEPNIDNNINADNFFINIYRAHPAIILDGARSSRIMTSSYDPNEVANEAGLTIYDGDTITPIHNANFLEAGIASVYEITRGDGSTLTVEEEIPFEENIIKDYSIPAGETVVEQYGEVGIKTLIYNIHRIDGKEESRELISETITRAPVTRIVHVGVSLIPRAPLTASKGRNRYTIDKGNGVIIERQETYYDLNMSLVVQYRKKDGCGDGTYHVREDGVKVDVDGYILVAANLDRYPLCSVVETSLGLGKVYDTGSFAAKNPEQFDIATDWTNRNGR